jgi:hypothetical protein
MMLLLTEGVREHGPREDPVGAARSPRDEGPTGLLPGLAAAAKKQLPHHGRASIAGQAGCQANPADEEDMNSLQRQ